MRCAVPSSKVGSCDSANAAAERDSGVDAAAGFRACAAFAVAPGVAAGLAGSGVVPEPAMPELWPNTGAAASVEAMATIFIIRIFDALGMRGVGADVEINKLGPFKPTSPAPVLVLAIRA